jgi:DNA-binding CsgD family transcriptional regulator
MALMDELFQMKLKDRQILELQQKKKFDEKIRVLFVILILLLLGFSWLIINKKNVKSKVKFQLLEREKEFMLTQQKLMETELSHIQLKDETLRNELESNAKSLTAQTLHVIDKNKMLEGIKHRLQDSLDKDAREQKKNIRNLIKLIEFNFVQDTDWDDFKKNFEKVHEGFFQKLNSKSKDLTPSELRLASLMRMNLSSKDIASTLNISQDSLRISRYRLRKKLALEKGESLQQFILCI